MKCCRCSKCGATLSILIKATENLPEHVLTTDVTEEITMDKENYDTIFHRHAHRCIQIVDSDGQCRSTKLEPEFNKNVDQQKNKLLI